MKKLLCILCTAFVALLSLSSCSKPKDSGSGDSDIVGKWTVKEVSYEIGGEKEEWVGEMTLTFDKSGVLYVHQVLKVGSTDDWDPVRWTKNGDTISLDGDSGDIQGFKILKNTTQNLDLMLIFEDPEDCEIWYTTRVN